MLSRPFKITTNLSFLSSAKYLVQIPYKNAFSEKVSHLAPAGIPASLYFPVKIPPHKGLQTVVPILWRSKSLAKSYSTLSLTNMLY